MNVFTALSDVGHNPARSILSSMRKIAPMIIHEDAPISYMAEGQALKFYSGEGELDEAEDPSTASYYIVRVLQDDNDETSQSLNESSNVQAKVKYGCRIIGVITCSDAFGVDLVVDQYNDSLAARAREATITKANLINNSPIELS
jgi:hypothetical protein